ncbi:unnamed protein product [Urochloa decumbens]|uniref:DUF1618 domain-containing protein n=1 Tax=Urochloa decumbens TaxID=240449 RepID=A0ABC9BFS4_9POAL
MTRRRNRHRTHPPPPPPPPPPTAVRRHQLLPPMVLVDRDVRFVDEVQAFIQESGGLSYDQAIDLVLDKYKAKGIYNREREAAYRAEQIRYGDEVEGPAFDALRERRRKAAADGRSAVRKAPLAFYGKGDAYYLDMLEGTEPCLSEVAEAPGVTRLSIKIAWPPPSRSSRSYPDRTAFVAGSHKSLLLLCLGNCSPGNHEPGFYMVYDTQANSVAIVPPILPRDGVFPWCPPCHIARGWGGGTVAIQSRSDGGYLLAELLLCRDGRRHRPTGKATLFTWISGDAQGQWISKEVELPIPCHQDHLSFRADMVFAVGPTSLCWVDLLSGVLVYNHTDDTASGFHFIPLHPKIGTDAMKKKELELGWPEEYRSMCCIDDNTLQFVSIEGFNQDIPVAEMMLTTWILKSPRSPTKWQWHLLHSVHIGDLWHDPHYDDLSLLPSFPVISTLQPHVIYLSVHNYEYNPKHDMMQATELYVLSLDMRLRGVVSAFKAPSEKNGCAPYLKTFTSDFTRYLNQTSGDLYKVCPRGKEVSDGGESAWTSVWISAPISCASSSLQMYVQGVGMSSDSDMNKVFVASVRNWLRRVDPNDPTVKDLLACIATEITLFLGLQEKIGRTNVSMLLLPCAQSN